MANAYNTLVKLWEWDRKLYIFGNDMSMGRLNFVGASKFLKPPAQLACNDFSQSFTPTSVC